mgnify:CR=1 FL=1
MFGPWFVNLCAGHALAENIKPMASSGSPKTSRRKYGVRHEPSEVFRAAIPLYFGMAPDIRGLRIRGDTRRTNDDGHSGMGNG